MIRCLQFLFIVVCLFFVSGCEAIIASRIAYESAVSEQEHAAYTDYYFSVLNTNLLLKKLNLALNPVIPEDKWRAEYRLRLEYTDYYYDVIAGSAKTNGAPFIPTTSFEEWKTNEYIRMQISQKANLNKSQRRR